jgi:LuxR family maltose regulon positive regulatory protein
LEQNELEQAERALRQGLDLIQWTGEVETQIVGYTALTRVHRAKGRPHDVLNAIAELERAWPTGAAYTSALRVLHQLWLAHPHRGAVDKASDWVEQNGPTLDEPSLFPAMGPGGTARHVTELTWARVRIAQARHQGAAQARSTLQPVLSYLNGRLDSARSQGLDGLIIELSLLEALALDARGETGRGLEVLGRALDLSEPGGYVRIFVDEGPPMARLLHEVASGGTAPDYVGQLLAAFPTGEPTPAELRTPDKPEQAELIEPLTERELEVLALLAEGLTNRVIADRLFISPHTVRAHTSSIYGKLAVHSRTEAAARARALGLL